MSVLDVIKAVWQAVAVALGLATEIQKDVSVPNPQLMDPPPPADSDALVHDLTEIRKKKFGK